MTDTRPLFIFGAGGFGREVAWLAEQIHGEQADVRFVVGDPVYLRGAVNGRNVDLITTVTGPGTFVVALGDPAFRRIAVTSCSAAGLIATRLLHPRAEISRWVTIGEGSIVTAGCIVTTNVEIGRHVHLNLDCTVGHDVVIGDYATLAPGVHVSGNVTIGDDVYVGTGAAIINGHADRPLTIGDGAVIAAGACVTRPVEPGAMVAGVPAVRKR